MNELNPEAFAVAPLAPDTDLCAVTQPPEPMVEIVEIAVAPLPSLAPPEPAGGTAETARADAADAPPGREPEPDADDEGPYPLSPAVRRLVRQYDLDVTGIHGTGPEGRIRVSDVIGLLGGRTDTTARSSEPRSGATFADERAERGVEAPLPVAEPVPAAAAARASTVFECDLSRVLGRRKRERQSNNVEPLLTSYFLAACREALHMVPEVAAKDGPLPARLGVLLAAADGEVRTSIVDTDEPPLPSLDERVRAFDRALRASGKAVLDTAELLIDNYGASGSLLMTPTPLGAGGIASIGIGRVRRTIVVKNVDGEEAPRVAAVCYVTLTFLPDRIAPHRANRFVAELVRVLEQWPD
ncbi:MAG TPA: E3 binding domain-containing protein [Gammaproteobacteria bacterium]|nr:E3 binding domain-containing protein [Gammaproteobacteria bacterium]